MKKLRFLGLLVVVLALSLAFIACNSDAGTGGGTVSGGGEETGPIFGGRGGGGGKGTLVTQGERIFSSGEYKIIITENQSRALYTPVTGDIYELYKGTNLVSKGRVTVVGNTYTFKLDFTPIGAHS